MKDIRGIYNFDRYDFVLKNLSERAVFEAGYTIRAVCVMIRNLKDLKQETLDTLEIKTINEVKDMIEIMISTIKELVKKKTSYRRMYAIIDGEIKQQGNSTKEVY